jgi:UDP-3-O-acyl-N-acetylglucosamine deacetylase
METSASAEHECGIVLGGDMDAIRRAVDRFQNIPVDWDLMDEAEAIAPRRQNTIAREISTVGPGTFLGKAQRRITLKPTDQKGWWFNRSDHNEYLPVGVSVLNVWTTGGIVSNIVLRSGPPSNYIRMVEHIVALRLGLDVDNLVIEMDSGDPPLFNRGSLDLVEAMMDAGRQAANEPVDYVTVKEKVTIGGPGGSFLTLAPADPRKPMLTFDCAVDFPTAIGQQRIRFPMNAKNFLYGAAARTNSSASKKLYCQTIGKCFADVRNLGYTEKNVLIAGRRKYVNEPFLIHEGKSLEAVWHRAVLDLAAALALIDRGRLLGHATSYKAGHTLDVNMVRLLYQMDLLKPVAINEPVTKANS